MMNVSKLIKVCGVTAPLFLYSLYAPDLKVTEQQYQLPVLKGNHRSEGS